MAARQSGLLDLPTQAAVLRIAGKCVEAAAGALSRLENPGDPKDLHAFRVAVRRLRSLLRAYRPWVGPIAGRKVRRRLRELTRATSFARDTDVLIDWLLVQRTKLDRPERAGADWFLRQLRGRKRRSYRSAVAELKRDFSGVVQLMKRRADDSGSKDPRDFRSAFLEVLGPAVAESRKRLAAIDGADDVGSVHRARVQVKRIRYLVEPLRKPSPEARVLTRQLKDLQRLLGELHDLHLIENELASAVDGDDKALAKTRRRDESLGLAALAASARESRDTLYSGLRRAWLAQRALALQAGFEALRDSLTPRTMEESTAN